MSLGRTFCPGTFLINPESYEVRFVFSLKGSPRGVYPDEGGTRRLIGIQFWGKKIFNLTDFFQEAAKRRFLTY